MARSTDYQIHVPQSVVDEIRQELATDERRELEKERFALNRTWEAQYVLQLALREYVRTHAGVDLDSSDNVEALPSGKVAVNGEVVDVDAGLSINPF